MSSAGRRVLLLVGSPKAPGKSVSEELGAYVIEKMGALGWSSESISIRTILQSEEGRAALHKAVDRADLIILSFPLYVDSLPAPVMRAMELIAARQSKKAARFVAIANCGFPEARHNDVAIAICRRFSLTVGMDWAGGLALGMGGAVSGRPLRDRAGIVANIVKSLDLTANALVNDESVPDKAVQLMAKPIIPGAVYTTIGNSSWRKQAKRYGVKKDLRNRPYQR